jgi:Na+-transporting methylmalonyl-CoA/oxaloacetate decarboxylase gamma subunit
MVSGYVLTVVGMSVVFMALGLLAVIAWGLERLFRTAEPPEQAVSEELHVEAVIACALAHHVKRKGSIHFDAVTESMWIQQGRIYHD